MNNVPPVLHVEAEIAGLTRVLEFPLSVVLDTYPLDKYQQDQIQPYLKEWGNRSFHEFMSYLIGLRENVPDLFGEMGRLNIFSFFREPYIKVLQMK